MATLPQGMYLQTTIFFKLKFYLFVMCFSKIVFIIYSKFVIGIHNLQIYIIPMVLQIVSRLSRS